MAVTTDLDATTQNVYVPLIVDNFAKGVPLVVALIGKARFLDGGQNIRQPVALASSGLATEYSGGDTLDVSYVNDFAACELGWAQYGTTISITGKDDLINSGKAAILSVISSKLQKYEVELRELLSDDIIQSDGTNAKKVVGLTAAIDDSTNVTTYGGLSRATYTNWKSKYSANGAAGRAVTLSLLGTQTGNATKGNTKPNLYLTSQAVINKLITLYQPNQRFIDDSKYASAGFQAVGYQNRPVIQDESVNQISSLDRMFILNTNYLDLYFHKARFFRYVPFQRSPNQDAATAMILVACQLLCSAPRLNCQIRDLDATL